MVELFKMKVTLGAVLGLGVALMIAAALMPTALINVSNATLLTSVNAAVKTMWTLVVPLVAVVVLLLMFLKFGRSK